MVTFKSIDDITKEISLSSDQYYNNEKIIGRYECINDFVYLKDDTNRGYTVTASTNNLEKTYDKADKNRKPGPTSLLTFKPKNENELLDLKVCYYMYGSAKCDVNNGQQLTGSIGEYLVEGEGMIAIVVLEDGKDEVT